MKKTIPHHRMTLSDVIADFKSGYITAKGAIFYGISAATKPGNQMRVQPKLICDSLGISLSTFYRVLSILIKEGRVQTQDSDYLTAKIPVKDGTPQYLFLRELSQISENHSQISENHSQIWENQQSKSLRLKGSSLPSTNTSNTSLLHGRERMERNPEFLEWLKRKASELPEMPTLLNQWIERQSKLSANQQEFLDWLSLKNKPPSETIFPAAAAANLPEEIIAAIAVGDSKLAYSLAIAQGIPVGEVRLMLLNPINGEEVQV